MGEQRTAFILILILCLLVVSIPEINVAKAESEIIVVPDDYPTIQEAINHANEGDTISVKAGTYYENVVVTKSIFLNGESSSNTIIDGGGGISRVVFVSSVDNVEINGFTIQNGYDGIYLWDSSYVTISGNIITNSSFRGIILSGSSSDTISENMLISNYDSVELYKSSGVTVFGNIIADSRFGISMSRSSTNIFSGNTLTNNEDGFYIWNSSFADVSGNTIINSSHHGISLIISSNCNLTGNTITNSASRGISLNNSSDCKVFGNTIANSTIQGILLSNSSRITVFENTLTNNFEGIISANCSNILISENQITKNIHEGVGLMYTSTATLIRNNIISNHYADLSTATGLVVFHCTDSEASENQIDGNDNGAVISNSQDITFSNNSVINNRFHGLNIVNGNGNRIFGSTMRNNTYGICPSGATNTQIYENLLQENECGIANYGASNNFIYHNYFIDNSIQANNFLGQEINSWDNSYPSGGNYWSDYNGTDTDGDGIGDTPYVIDGNNQDNYPLMNPRSPHRSLSYELIVDSMPVGVTFTVDNISCTARWSEIYNETSSITLVIPKTHSIEGANYIWWQWSDGNTNRTRTVTVDKSMALTAIFRPEDTSLKISVLSPENKIYTLTNVPLEITVNRDFYLMSYSLDRQANVTIVGNTTLIGLSEGAHNITVYIEESPGLHSISNIIHFTVDTTPPNITDVSWSPLNAYGTLEDGVKVNAIVEDSVSKVEWVALNYTKGSGTWIIVQMTNLEGTIWNYTLPVFPHGTNVTYIIVAKDEVGNIITSEELFGHPIQYKVLPEFPSWIILPYVLIISLFAIIIKKKALHKHS